MESVKNKRRKNQRILKFTKKYFILITITIGILVAVTLPSLFLFNDAFKGSSIDANNASQFGSFVGGYIGCILSFISITFLLITLREQKLANYYQSFENKFFEMIKLHRDNLKEAGGRKLFVNLIREFREIHKNIKDIFTDYPEITFTNEELFSISFTVLFYGIGPNSSRELRCALKKYKSSFVDTVINRFEDRRLKRETQKSRSFPYVPFEGHQSRLGHYFCHLYQTICYVDGQKSLLFEQKYSYIKIVRAQLSTHELAVLFVNSLTDMGKSWDKQGLIQDYCLIKNLPEDFFDREREIDVKEKYSVN